VNIRNALSKNFKTIVRNIAANRWSILSVALSGFLLRFAYPRWDIWWLAWLAPVPFIYILFNASPRRSFWLGWLFGFCFFYPTVFWLNTLIAYNPFIPLGIFILGLAMGLSIAIFALCCSFFELRMPQWRWLYIPALWVVIEYLRGIAPFGGFAWAFMAHTHYQQIPFIQVADIVGVYGISFVIVTGHVLLAGIAHFLVRKRKGASLSRSLIINTVVFATLIALTLTYGLWKLQVPDESRKHITVGVVQPNVPQDMKLTSYASPDAEIRETLQVRILKDLARLILELKGQTDCIICPETSITDVWFTLNEELQDFMVQLAQKAGAPILFGADNTTVKPGENYADKMYNSAWLAHPDTGISDKIYNKMHLVPFGEYVPLASVIPFLQNSIVQIGNFDAGTESTIFTINKGTTKFGVMICFESSVSSLARHLANRGAEFIVVITNDGWYGKSAGAYQHFPLSIFRAIETGRPIVRAANTGISAVISPKGKILAQTKLQQQITFTTIFTPTTQATLYSKVGDVPILILILILLVLLSVNLVRSRKR
jgi:apolipoprotein N-acyltransferase